MFACIPSPHIHILLSYTFQIFSSHTSPPFSILTSHIFVVMCLSKCHKSSGDILFCSCSLWTRFYPRPHFGSVWPGPGSCVCGIHSSHGQHSQQHPHSVPSGHSRANIPNAVARYHTARRHDCRFPLCMHAHLRTLLAP